MLKKALAYDGLSRGLHEAARAIEKGQAKLCVLAEDCNQPDYKKVSVLNLAVLNSIIVMLCARLTAANAVAMQLQLQ